MLASNLLFPITYDDDFAYSVIGNPFLLQWNEYLAWHGRLVSHTLLRIILQLPSPIEEIVFSGVILWVIITCYRAVNPQFIHNAGKHDFPLFILLFCLLFVFVPVSSTAYVMVTFFMSNLFAIGLICWFLTPYSLLMSTPSIAPSRMFWLSALLAGASHEQAVALLPLLLILYIILKYKKIMVPRWFWTGGYFFLLGYAGYFVVSGFPNPHRKRIRQCSAMAISRSNAKLG